MAKNIDQEPTAASASALIAAYENLSELQKNEEKQWFATRDALVEAHGRRPENWKHDARYYVLDALSNSIADLGEHLAKIVEALLAVRATTPALVTAKLRIALDVASTLDLDHATFHERVFVNCLEDLLGVLMV